MCVTKINGLPPHLVSGPVLRTFPFVLIPSDPSLFFQLFTSEPTLGFISRLSDYGIYIGGEYPSVNVLLLLLSIELITCRPSLVTQGQAAANWPRDLYLMWPSELSWSTWIASLMVASNEPHGFASITLSCAISLTQSKLLGLCFITAS